jgi:deoxycytidylate deaminase
MKKLPFLPVGKIISYVPEDNEFMQAAKKAAEELSLDKKHQTGVVIVKDSQILSQGANGSAFHKNFCCLRKLVKASTGKLYWLCPGCSPKNHAEQTAIRNAKKAGITVEGADLYLWGHWWCCEPCWNAMINANIKNVFLYEGAYEKFDSGRT